MNNVHASADGGFLLILILLLFVRLSFEKKNVFIPWLFVLLLSLLFILLSIRDFLRFGS